MSSLKLVEGGIWALSDRLMKYSTLLQSGTGCRSQKLLKTCRTRSSMRFETTSPTTRTPNGSPTISAESSTSSLNCDPSVSRYWKKSRFWNYLLFTDGYLDAIDRIRLLIHISLSGPAEDLLPKAWRPRSSTTIDWAHVCFKYSLLKYFERKYLSDKKYSLLKLLIWQADTSLQVQVSARFWEEVETKEALIGSRF